MKIKNLKLGTRMSIVMILLAIIPVLIISISQNNKSEAALKKTQIEKMITIANNKKREIEKTFNYIIETANEIPLTSNNRTQIIEKLNILSEYAIIDNQKSITESSNLSYFQSLLESPKNQTIIEKLTKKNETTLSETFTQDQNEEITMLVSKPVIINETRQGTILFKINLKYITDIIYERSDLGTTGEIVIAHSEGDHAIFTFPLRYDHNAALKRKIYFDDSPVARPIKEATQGIKDSGIAIDYRGEPIIAAWEPITLPSSKYPWGIVAKIDLNEGIAAVTDLKKSTYTLTVTFFIIIIHAGYYFSRTITKPLEKVKDYANNIALGNYDENINIDAHDEVGELTSSITHMAQTLIAQKEAVTETQSALKKNISTLEERNSSLNNVKKAMINILEDLETEKAKITASKAKDEALLSSIGDGMIAIESDLTISVINKAAEKILKIKKEESIGKKLFDVITVTDEEGKSVPDNAKPALIALNQNIKTSNNKLLYKNKEDYTVPVSITAAPIISNEKAIGVIIIFRDITKEKNIDRMKTEFISLASHQLRTPLSAIKWFLEMLLNGDAGKISDEQKEMLENVNQSNERMIQLVNSLLNISRIESGRIIIDPKPTNLNTLVSEILTEIEGRAKEKDIHIIFSSNENIQEIMVDPKLIYEVYKNLITNAIKYSPEKSEITIIISSKENEIISQVSDNGYGIPEKDQHRIFQKFFRAENILEHDTDGNGLGLYLTKAIVESSGGKISFESSVGKGTTFFFSLPKKGSKKQEGNVSLNS